MRKVVAAVFVSLDGVMQAPGAPGEDPSGGFVHEGWVFPHFDEAVGAMMEELFSQPFDLLLGRRTYDIFAAHWPRTKADDPIGSLFNACTKYVATRSEPALEWGNAVALRDDGAAEVRTLKQGVGPTLLVQGSSDFLQSLLGAGLVDEFRLIVFPVVLGSGKRLFPAGAPPQALTLIETRSSPSGALLAVYRPAGEVVTGSFRLEDEAAA